MSRAKELIDLDLYRHEVMDHCTLCKKIAYSRRCVVLPEIAYFDSKDMNSHLNRNSYSLNQNPYLKTSIEEEIQKSIQILFVGEAPGKSEDLLGVPFIGPSGKLLRTAIETAIETAIAMSNCSFNGSQIYINFANSISCRPSINKGHTNRDPLKEELTNCYNHLKKVIEAIDPNAIVALGSIAYNTLKNEFPHCHKIPHPAYILRKGGLSTTTGSFYQKQISEIIKQSVTKVTDL